MTSLALKPTVMAAGFHADGKRPAGAELARPTVRRIVEEAERRRIGAHELAVQILETVARDNLFAAVLDDAAPAGEGAS